MLRFLSSEWLDALDEAANGLVVPDDMALVIEQVVSGDDGEEAAYHLVFAAGSVRVRPGRARTPTVTVHQAYATAAALARGEFNAQQAMARGLLRVSGDVTLLSRHGRVLGRLPDLFAGLRHRTEF